MKILKPGKVETRKFVCPDCGCEFICGECDEAISWHEADMIIICPTCKESLLWEKGEPYEEPAPTRTERERLAKMLFASMPQSSIGRYDLVADYLIEHGVTFREETNEQADV